MPLIAPSILAANFLNLEKDIEMVNASKADWFHLDVMDGRFVPNISFGLPVISAIHQKAKKNLDVHLMMVEPEKYFSDFQKAGAHVLTIHAEVAPHLHRQIQAIKTLGMKAGVALNPSTPIEVLSESIHDIDLVCMMSVNPGFGGQKFIEHTYDKVRRLKQLILERGAATLIEIDGGVTIENAKALCDAGADVLVAGNTVFSSDNPTETIEKLKHIAD